MLDRAFRFDSEGRSDTGRVRSLNEDSFLMRPDIGLWAVADGMGGHDAGDFASQTLVAELNQLTRPESAPALLTAMEAGVLAANGTLRRAARERGNGTIIGCTLASLVIYKGAYACVWSGDSRVYRVRGGQIEQISRDHTEAQELVDRGTITAEEARIWPRKNVITRAIGVFDTPELEMVQGRVEDGDIFVICSDGLTEHVKDDEILRATASRPTRRICDELIELTLERGAKDNVTVIAICCRETTNLQPEIDWTDWGQA
jgi:serine/threonine protein phosphatase PrpC